MESLVFSGPSMQLIAAVVAVEVMKDLDLFSIGESVSLE